MGDGGVSSRGRAVTGSPTGKPVTVLAVLGFATLGSFMLLVMRKYLSATSLAILAVAYWLGLRERRRIGPEAIAAYKLEIASDDTADTVRTDWRMWFNAGLTVLLMVLLVLEVAELVVLFMVAFVIALIVNIRVIADQQDLIKRHPPTPFPS